MQKDIQVIKKYNQTEISGFSVSCLVFIFHLEFKFKYLHQKYRQK